MDMATRSNLEKLAVRRAAETADDEEPWSFLYRTEGAVGGLFCPWSETEDYEFDGNTGLDLPWTQDRREAIANGEADPTDEELLQWRRALALHFAHGTESCAPIWIVPLRLDAEIAGYALFV